MTRRTARILGALLVAFLLTVAADACAHKPSDSYLTLRIVGAEVTGQWDLALRDLAENPNHCAIPALTLPTQEGRDSVRAPQANPQAGSLAPTGPQWRQRRIHLG